MNSIIIMWAGAEYTQILPPKNSNVGSGEYSYINKLEGVRNVKNFNLIHILDRLYLGLDTIQKENYYF